MKYVNNSGLVKIIALIVGLIVVVIVSVMGIAGLNDQGKKQVVVYASVDQVFSEPILKEFESKTGIDVLPVYDVEAAKTTGISNRLLAEKDKPEADVFWSGEFSQTIMLKEKGVLKSYKSINAKDIPLGYKDKEGYWTGFGGRARVLLVNTDKMQKENYPEKLADLLNDKYEGNQIGIAYPLFGTTSTHAAALYAKLGDIKAKEFFMKLKKKGVMVVDGNSVVRDLVANGQLTMGLTDTDDALSAKKKGKPVELVFLDQGNGEMGTFVIPNTVALINGAPNEEEGKQFVDFMLAKEIEKELYNDGWIDFTLRPIDGLEDRIGKKNLIKMEVNFEDVFKQLKKSAKELAQIFIK